MAVELGSLPERTMNQIQHVEKLDSTRPSRRRQKERSNNMMLSSKQDQIRQTNGLGDRQPDYDRHSHIQS